MCFELIVNGEQKYFIPRTDIKEIEIMHTRKDFAAPEAGEETTRVTIKTNEST